MIRGQPNGRGKCPWHYLEWASTPQPAADPDPGSLFSSPHRIRIGPLTCVGGQRRRRAAALLQLVVVVVLHVRLLGDPLAQRGPLGRWEIPAGGQRRQVLVR